MNECNGYKVGNCLENYGPGSGISNLEEDHCECNDCNSFDIPTSMNTVPTSVKPDCTHNGNCGIKVE